MAIRKKSLTDGKKQEDYEIVCDEHKCTDPTVPDGSFRDKKGHVPREFEEAERRFIEGAENLDKKGPMPTDILDARKTRKKVIEEHIKNKPKP